MHSVMLRQLAADHIRELVTEAGDARQARAARRARRGRPPAHVRRSTRLYAQQREPRLGAGTLAGSGADDRVDSSRR
jgi:hypothetical protein